jgi:hypothetical protein
MFRLLSCCSFYFNGIRHPDGPWFILFLAAFLRSGSTFGSTVRRPSSCDSVPFVRARSLGSRPKENPNRERQNSAPLRPSDRILGIASDASERTICKLLFGRNPASAFHAKSIHNRQSFSGFRDLATVSRTFEGRQMLSELPPHCYRAADQYRAGTRHRVKEVPAPILIQIQFIRSAALHRVQTHVWLSPLMIVRPFPQSDLNPLWESAARHTAGIILNVCGEIPRISARLPR